MKIILKYIITNLKERKTRTLVMFLSIILSTVLLFVSLSIGSSYENAQRKMARGLSGTATISVSPQDLSGVVNLHDIPESSSIQAKVGILEASAMYHEDGYYEPIDLVGADLASLNQINKPRLLTGGEIKNFTGDQIILPDRFTSKFGLKKGDAVTIEVNEVPITFTLHEIAAYDTAFLREERGATALIPEATLAKILQKGNGYNQILIKPSADTSTETLIDTLTKELPSSLTVSSTVNEAQIVSGAREKSMPFFLISFFSLTMSAFIIYSSYKVITLDRLPVIGTFRSIGATQKTVTKILLLESVLYGCISGIAGIPIGIGILKLILNGMGNSLSQGIEIPAVITWTSILCSFGVAVLASILSAWIPITRASRLPIKSIVLGTVEEKTISNGFIVGTGVVLFIVSVFLPNVGSGKMLYLTGGFSLLGLLIATILIIPLVTNLLSKFLEYIYAFIFKNEGMLAARNMRNNKNITQNITLLFISISSIIAITVVGNFVNTYIADVFHGAEIEGFADGEFDQDFANKVENMEGIEKVLPLYIFMDEVKCEDVAFPRLEATHNLEWFNSMFHLIYTDKAMEGSAISNFSKTRSVVVSEDWLKTTDFKVGDVVTLTNGSKNNSYTITGSFKSRATDAEAIISSSYAVTDFKPENYGFLAYTASDPDSIMVQIRNLFGSTSNWSRSVAEFYSDAQSTVGTFLKPMRTLTYFILLLATFGIINNLLINYIQKRRSIAMYKSVGLSNRQNIKMTIIEGLTAGMIGALIAMGVSYLEIKTIFLVAGPKISVLPKLEVKTFLWAGLMGIVITLIGSVVPILKSKHMKLVEEIKM